MRQMKHLIATLLLVTGGAANAQFQNDIWTGKQANNWYWSFNLGLSFNSGVPQLASGGQTAVMEGTAVMSDENGQLLFYASNGTVWNKNHVQMLNGNNMLAGDQSSTQSGIIIPKPGNPGIYYLFNEDIYDGLVYSEIDMSMDSGLGAVTVIKNVVLEPNARNEKLTAVYHTDKERIWLISHLEGNNEFIAYLISSDGIATAPVVSAVGMSFTTEAPSISVTYNCGGSAGQLKVSPDGTKLASVQRIGEIVGASIVNGKVEIFDFNASTGEIANPTQITTTNNAFGIEFSPNSRYLYILDNQYMPWVGMLGTTIEKMYQYDLQAANIPASAVMTGQYTSRFSSALQLGPDGKIYMMNSASLNTLVAVAYPNNAGTASGLTTGVLTLADSDSIGMPTFNQTYFRSGITYTTNCGNDVAFELVRIPGITTVEWNFGDPASGSSNISPVAQHTFSSPGTYTVTATITSNGATQTATQQVTVDGVNSFPALANLSACSASGTAVFNLSQQTAVLLNGLDPSLYSVAYYSSAQDAASGTNAIATPDAFTSTGQSIYVTVTETSTGCDTTIPFSLTVTAFPTVPQLPQLQLCGSNGTETAIFNLTQQEALITQPNVTVSYFTSADDAAANTNQIVNATSFTNTENPQTIYVRLANGNCPSVGSFTLSVTLLQVLPQFPALTTCATSSINQEAFDLTQQQSLITQAGVTVSYYTSATDATAGTNAIVNTSAFVNTANPQTIYIRASNGNCFATASFTTEVIPMPVPTITVQLFTCPPADITTATAGNNGGLQFSYYTTETDAENAENPIANAQAYVYQGTTSTVYIRSQNSEGCYAINPVVISSEGCIIPRGISPNGDNKNDEFDLTFIGVQKLIIYNRYGMEVYSLSNYTNQWHGQTSGGNDLPTGVYFYVMEPNTGTSKTGWVYVNRESR